MALPDPDRFGLALQLDRSDLPLSRSSRPRVRAVSSPISTVPGGPPPGGGRRCSRCRRSRGPRPVLTSACTTSPVFTPDAQLKCVAVASAELRLDLLEGADERQPGANRALRVVIARARRAEDGHCGVTDELLDRSAVALDRLAAWRRSTRPGRSQRPRRRAASDSVVKPTRSANSTLTMRRSTAAAAAASSGASAMRGTLRWRWLRAHRVSPLVGVSARQWPNWFAAGTDSQARGWLRWPFTVGRWAYRPMQWPLVPGAV